MRTAFLGVVVTLCFSHALAQGTGTGVTLSYHEIRVDNQGMMIPWYSTDLGTAYDHDLILVWNFWKTQTGTCPNGVPYYLQHQVWSSSHDSRGLGGDQLAMALSSWSLLYAYSGDSTVLDNMKLIADYYLDHSLSAAGGAWPLLPYPYNTVVHSGVYDGDMVWGRGTLQPDKAASFASELVTLYEMTGNERYATSAISIADTLTARVAAGDASHSPWPYRVDAGNGSVKEAYTTNWTGALRLYDALIRLGRGNTAGYATARATVIAWLRRYPLQTNSWGPFFEDTSGWSDTETNADTFAWYVLEHPSFSSTWQADARAALNWSYATFANHTWSTYGVTAINEQTGYQAPGNSHTSRHWSTELLYAEKTGDVTRKADAIRGLNWATYMVADDGRNRYPNDDIWLTDGYGDYVRHYLRAMGAAPELAPAGQSHLLRSTSAVSSIVYSPSSVSYAVHDAASRQVLRLAFRPLTVTAGGASLARLSSAAQLDSSEGYTFEAPGDASGVLRIRHDASGSVSISASGGSTDTTPPARSNGRPTGTLPSGTTQATLSLATDEPATCRYALSAGIAYASMTSTFATTGGTAHATNVTGLSNGQSYTYYVRCQDVAPSPNANTTDFVIGFSVAAANRPPVARLAANPSSGSVPLNVTFDGTASRDPDGDALAYDWNFGDGTPHSSNAVVTHTYTQQASYDVVLTVRDPFGASSAAGLRISAGTSASRAGLVAAYGFEEGTGVTTSDSSGNGNTGTVTGASWVGGRNGGKALSFNGTNNYVTIADSSSLDLRSAMTLETWVYPRSLSSWCNVLMKERSGHLVYALYANTDTNQPSTEITTSSNLSASGNSQLPLNAWSHMAATYDGANLVLYVNGVPAGTRAVTGSLYVSTNPLRIGGNSVWGEYFNGVVDDVRIFNRALTQAEIQADMAAPVGR